MIHHNLVHKIYSHASSNEDSRCKKQQWIRDGKKARNDSSMATGESQDIKGRLLSKHKRDKKNVHFATLMDMCHFKNAELSPQLQ